MESGLSYIDLGKKACQDMRCAVLEEYEASLTIKREKEQECKAISSRAMAKSCGHKAKKGVVVNTRKRGRNVKSPQSAFKAFRQMERKVHNTSESLALRAGKAAWAVS